MKNEQQGNSILSEDDWIDSQARLLETLEEKWITASLKRNWINVTIISLLIFVLVFIGTKSICLGIVGVFLVWLIETRFLDLKRQTVDLEFQKTSHNCPLAIQNATLKKVNIGS